ncbi:MAG: phosphoenolpyruvate--protein phosphotransferase, partial [Bacteroidota bacterium]
GIRYRGTPASPGVIVGPVRWATRRELDLPEETIAESEIARHQELARRQMDSTERRLQELKQTQSDPEIRAILDAQMSMIQDPELLKRVLDRIENDRYTVDYALYSSFNEFIQIMRQSGQAWVKDRIVDLVALRDRMVQQSSETDTEDHPMRGAVLFADELSPTEVIEYSERGLGGIVMRHGGTTSHAVIISQALRIPCMVGVMWKRTELEGATTAALDAGNGEVVIDPDPSMLDEFDRREREENRVLEESRRIVLQPSETACGSPFDILANIEFEVELERLDPERVRGIGLLRSETLFLRQGYFDADRHRHFYEKALETTGDQPVTLRLLDIGGDKLPGRQHEEANPFLGWRGVRMLLDERELLQAQLRAIFQAHRTHPGRLRILVPMVSDVAELREIRSRVEELAKEMEIATPPPVGVMVEVPALALQAREVARESDFFSIGSNDLTQYVLAADRGNEKVSALYDSSHPAVWRLIRMTVEAANEEGIPVSVCGEMAGQPLLAGALLGLGVRELSMNPSSIPAVKKLICAHSLNSFRELAEQLLSAQGREASMEALEQWRTS